MARWTIFAFAAAFLLASIGNRSLAGDPASAESKAAGTASKVAARPERVYPIAPGVWYPGDGPIPEHPMRYYRVRCWPGCHHGSKFGKYPDQPLKMKPIHRTSALRDSTGEYRVTE